MKRYREKRQRKQVARHGPHHQHDEEVRPVVPEEAEPVLLLTAEPWLWPLVDGPTLTKEFRAPD